MRSVLKNILLVAVVLVVCALLLEAMTRLFVDDGLTYELEMWKYATRVKVRDYRPDMGHKHGANKNAEKTLGELRNRIAAVLEALKAFKPEQIDGSENRPIELTIGGNPMKFTGAQYLTGLALPNFYFHCTTTYAILRQAGVEIGKRDFLGAA